MDMRDGAGRPTLVEALAILEPLYFRYVAVAP